MNELDAGAEPSWTKRDSCVTVWSEDDATVGLEGHESPREAYRRIYGSEVPTAIAVYDAGDAVFKLLPGGLVLVDSYPGNSEIRRLKESKLG